MPRTKLLKSLVKRRGKGFKNDKYYFARYDSINFPNIQDFQENMPLPQALVHVLMRRLNNLETTTTITR